MKLPARHYISSALNSFTCLGLAYLVVAGCASVSERPVMPISDVIALADSGASSEVMIGQINSSRTVYALRGSDFANLAGRGVPPPVLDELQQSFFSEVENLTLRWYRARTSGGPTSIYPQPLDLDSLDGGGNGMAPTTNVGRATHGTRPPGVPEWVPPFPATSGQYLGPRDLLKMTESGLSTPEIVDKIMNSRVRPLYASSSGGSNARLGAITGSMFATLVERGVAPQAVDALQAINLADHVESTRFRAGGGY
ncbi:MAG: hypothetical protein JSU95_14635 [Betaproteobacteria bacterium]|nr:MAG: hypothetical protein JSU95_14635 [Betaproteobacteria bacterium]